MATAGAVIIGDEILSGKIVDSNTPLLIEVLGRAGVRLRRVVIVGDDPDDIAEAVRECSIRYDHVFCSGGLGPTHDDRTIEGLARAFDRKVVRHPELVRLLNELLADQVTEAALKMAEVVEGTELVPVGRFPAFALENVFVLPGIPQIFASKLAALEPRFAATPPVTRRLYLGVYESAIAEELARADSEFEAVQIGSYPQMGGDYKVMVTVEADDTDEVDRAIDRLLELLPPETIITVD